MRKAMRPRQIARRIVVDPEVRFGQPVIKGTRVPVSVLLDELAAGSEVAEITREYGVTKEDVRAAIEAAPILMCDLALSEFCHRSTPGCIPRAYSLKAASGGKGKNSPRAPCACIEFHSDDARRQANCKTRHLPF